MDRNTSDYKVFMQPTPLNISVDELRNTRYGNEQPPAPVPVPVLNIVGYDEETDEFTAKISAADLTQMVNLHDIRIKERNEPSENELLVDQMVTKFIENGGDAYKKICDAFKSTSYLQRFFKHK